MRRLLTKITELYRYRTLLWNLVGSELKLRYRRSVLGFLWTMLNPLLMMVVLTLVFSTVMRFGIKDYSVLLLAGLLPWSFFSQSVNNSLMSVVGKGNLIKKVYIPKAIIPLSAVMATLVNFLLSMMPFLLLIVAVGHPLNASALFLPTAIIFMALFACGFAFLFSCLNVFFRDFGHMTEVLLQVLFYASPIIYTVEMLPEKYRHLFRLNPLFHLIDCFRAPLFEGHLPSTNSILIAAIAGFATFGFGFVTFVRFERYFVLRV